MRAKFSELSYTGAAPKCCAQAGGEKEPWLTAEQIPECKWKDRGLAPTGLLAGLEHGEEVVALLPRSGAGESLLFVTARGLVKRTLSSEYGARKGRVAAIGLKEGDALLRVLPFNAEENLMLLTERAMAIRIDGTEIPVNGRAAAGVRGMALEPGDKVCFADFVPDAGELVMMSERGYAKRCLLVDFEVQRRAGKGVKAFSFNKNGANGSGVVFASVVTEPYVLHVQQADRTVTDLGTEEILIESKAGRGKPYLVALMDNVVTKCWRD